MQPSATTAITDFTQFAGLRASAGRNDPDALRQVASQFEALFLKTIMKNMRAGQLAEPLFGSDQHEMYLEMMDQQLAAEMARGRGLGFADLLVRQLGEGATTPTASTDRRAAALAPVSPPAVTAAAAPTGWSEPAGFVRDLWPHVRRIAETLSVAPEAVLAQAALETGWGRHVMQRADGSSSNNLFGIKAGSDWFGGSVLRPTIEFAGGVAEQVRARFRAYPDIAATFDDYGALLGGNPRYAAALDTADDASGFAQALQDAGYATDPDYAHKIRRILTSDTLKDALRSLKPGRALPISTGSTSDAAP